MKYRCSICREQGHTYSPLPVAQAGYGAPRSEVVTALAPKAERGDAMKRNERRLLVDAVCLLASTVLTMDRVLTAKQKRERRRILAQAPKVLAR